MLTLRFFVQDNEPTSFRRMATMYPQLPVEQSLVDDALEVRQRLNAVLDSHPSVNLNVDGKDVTRRDVFEVFMWGTVAC